VQTRQTDSSEILGSVQGGSAGETSKGRAGQGDLLDFNVTVMSSALKAAHTWVSNRSANPGFYMPVDSPVRATPQ